MYPNTNAFSDLCKKVEISKKDTSKCPNPSQTTSSIGTSINESNTPIQQWDSINPSLPLPFLTDFTTFGS